MTELLSNRLADLQRSPHWILGQRQLTELAYLTNLKILDEIEALKSRLPEPATQTTTPP